MADPPVLGILRCGRSAERPLSLARAQAFAAAADPAGWGVVELSEIGDAGPGAAMGTAEPPVDAVVLIGAHPAEIAAHLSRGRAVLLDGADALTRAEADQVVALASAHRQPVVIGDDLLHAASLSAALTAATRIGPLTHIEARILHPSGRPAPATVTEWNELALPAIHRVLLALRRLRADSASVTWEGVQASPGTGRGQTRLTGRLMGSPGTRLTVIVGEHGGRSVIQDIQLVAATGVVRGELMPDVHLEVDGAARELPAPVHTPAQLEVFGMIPMLELLRRAVAQRTQPLSGPTLLAEALAVSEWAWVEAVDPSR